MALQALTDSSKEGIPFSSFTASTHWTGVGTVAKRKCLPLTGIDQQNDCVMPHDVIFKVEHKIKMS
jgi:hypothetical protein